MDGYERSQFVGRHFPSFTNVANSGKNCKKRLILFSSNPRKKTTSWQRFWKFEPWKMMTTREIAGRGGGGSAIFSPYLISHTFLKWELQIWNLLQIFLYIGEGGAQGVKKGTAPPPTCLPPDQIFDNRFFKFLMKLWKIQKCAWKPTQIHFWSLWA